MNPPPKKPRAQRTNRPPRVPPLLDIDWPVLRALRDAAESATPWQRTSDVGRRVDRSPVHSLQRLQAHGYVDGHKTDPAVQASQYEYRITPAGTRALETAPA